MKTQIACACVTFFGLLSADAGEPPASGPDFFNTRVRPVLEENCYGCHSARANTLKGGLRLDSKSGWQRGGDSGHPAVIPGKPAASPLMDAVEWADEDTRMPPRKKLSDVAIADIHHWIEMGAPDPRVAIVTSRQARTPMDIEEGRKFWAFQPPKKTGPPVADGSWPHNDIDRFLLAAMKGKGLHPAPDADPDVLIRRATFDLTGLPPVPDASHESYEGLVDRLLDSPRFGEKWGRHWLDVARYAESSGRSVNFLYPEAWRYRDYVIASFNSDKPYDQFVKEQIAGDLLPHLGVRDQAEKIIATGFLAIGAKSHDEADRVKFLMDVADEQIDTVTRSMLGLSVACARCHDHKHDPISQRDYHAVAGIFLSSETLFGTAYQLQNWNHSSLIEIAPAAGLPSARVPVTPQGVAALDRKVFDTRREQIRTSFTREADRYNARKARVDASFAKAERDLYDGSGRPKTLVMGVLEREAPTDSRLLNRGEVSQPGETVPRGLVRILSSADLQPIKKGSGRLELAECMASKTNPLTARVMVNRVWSKLFGRGIVATPDDFGRLGALPSHPELLDYLALRFMEQGWSVKKLIREIMMSRAYQQSSAFDAGNNEIDPDNQFVWRMSRRRLDAESVRDAMLAVSGGLDLHPPVGSPVALLKESTTGPDDLVAMMKGRAQPCRSVFLPIVRGQSPAALACFDFADPGMVCGQRNVTNVPAQSLFLLNDEFVQSQADTFAARVMHHGGSMLEMADYAFQLALYRKPTAAERTAVLEFIHHFSALAPAGDPVALLSAYGQSLFATGEFRYLN